MWNQQGSRHSILFRAIAGFVLFSFFMGGVMPSQAMAQGLNLPVPGVMVNRSEAYVPVISRGLKVHPKNPLLFDFIVDAGDSGMAVEGLPFKAEAEKLIKYFLAALTVKADDQWVNLSPYEKDRIIPEDLGKTELGRDMLAQDYILKQLTASLVYPEKGLGKEFWAKIYAKARAQFGTIDIPVDTFNKVWITADKARVLERHNTAYITDAHLKVMLESDYLAATENEKFARRGGSVTRPLLQDTQAPQGADRLPSQELARQVMRDIIIPQIEQEVNEGKNFTQLRQIFYAMILSTWYKRALKNALLNQVYTNKSKINGVTSDDPAVKEKIYAQYLAAYCKGVFNYIKEEPQASGESIARKYFSGGLQIPPGIENAMIVDHAADTLVPSSGKQAVVAMGVHVTTAHAGTADEAVVDTADETNGDHDEVFTKKQAIATMLATIKATLSGSAATAQVTEKALSTLADEIKALVVTIPRFKQKQFLIDVYQTSISGIALDSIPDDVSAFLKQLYYKPKEVTQDTTNQIPDARLDEILQDIMTELGRVLKPTMTQEEVIKVVEQKLSDRTIYLKRAPFGALVVEIRDFVKALSEDQRKEFLQKILLSVVKACETSWGQKNDQHAPRHMMYSNSKIYNFISILLKDLSGGNIVGYTGGKNVNQILDFTGITGKKENGTMSYTFNDGVLTSIMDAVATTSGAVDDGQTTQQVDELLSRWQTAVAGGRELDKELLIVELQDVPGVSNKEALLRGVVNAAATQWRAEKDENLRAVYFQLLKRLYPGLVLRRNGDLYGFGLDVVSDSVTLIAQNWLMVHFITEAKESRVRLAAFAKKLKEESQENLGLLAELRHVASGTMVLADVNIVSATTGFWNIGFTMGLFYKEAALGTYFNQKINPVVAAELIYVTEEDSKDPTKIRIRSPFDNATAVKTINIVEMKQRIEALIKQGFTPAELKQAVGAAEKALQSLMTIFSGEQPRLGIVIASLQAKDPRMESIMHALFDLKGADIVVDEQNGAIFYDPGFDSSSYMNEVFWYLKRLSSDYGKIVSKSGAGDDQATVTAVDGGIDINSNNLTLDVAREGRGVEMTLDPAMVAQFERGDFSGVVPVILNITPISSPLPLLGMRADGMETSHS